MQVIQEATRQQDFHEYLNRETLLQLWPKLPVGPFLDAWLTAGLLERLRPGIFSSWGGDPDDIVERTYERMGRAVPVPMDGFRIQNDMATALREGLDLATAP